MIKMQFVAKRGNPFNEILKEINDAEKSRLEELNTIGFETASMMKQIINGGKVRPQSEEPTDLESAIEVEFFEGGWGVGALDTLAQKAKYWAAVNFGSSHMVGKHLPPGTFNPGEPKPTNSFFRVGRWKKGEDYNGKTYSPIVKKPIPPMNFIEKTAFWLSNKLNEMRG